MYSHPYLCPYICKHVYHTHRPCEQKNKKYINRKICVNYIEDSSIHSIHKSNCSRRDILPSNQFSKDKLLGYDRKARCSYMTQVWLSAPTSGHSQLPATPVPGSLSPSSNLQRIIHTYGAHIGTEECTCTQRSSSRLAWSTE